MDKSLHELVENHLIVYNNLFKLLFINTIMSVEECLKINDYTLTRIEPDDLEGQRAHAIKEREGKLVAVFDFHNYLLSGVVKNSNWPITYQLETPTKGTFDLSYHDILAVFDINQD